MKYYLLREDVQFPERWYLGDIKHCNNWLFIDPLLSTWSRVPTPLRFVKKV